MGRKQVLLNVDGDILRSLLKEFDSKRLSERAEKYGVTKQALSNWISQGKVPPRFLAELALEFGLSADALNAILLKAPPLPMKRVFKVTIEEVADE